MVRCAFTVRSSLSLSSPLCSCGYHAADGIKLPSTQRAPRYTMRRKRILRKLYPLGRALAEEWNIPHFKWLTSARSWLSSVRLHILRFGDDVASDSKPSRTWRVTGKCLVAFSFSLSTANLFLLTLLGRSLDYIKVCCYHRCPYTQICSPPCAESDSRIACLLIWLSPDFYSFLPGQVAIWNPIFLH